MATELVLESVRGQLEAWVRSHQTPGLQYLFARQGRVLLSCEAGLADPARSRAMAPQHTFNLYSITKLWTAAAVLLCVRKGLIALEAPLGSLLPGRPKLAGATVRQTLLHTAGFDNPLPLGWVHLARETFDPQRFVTELLERHGQPVRAPGDVYRYSNIGYLWLGRMVRTVTGRSLAQWLHEQLLSSGVGAPDGAVLGFEAPLATRQARGTFRRWSWVNPLLGLVLERDRFVAGHTGSWVRLEHHQVNGPAYGGMIGNAAGLMSGLQQLLDLDGLASSGCPQGLFQTVPVSGPARSLGGATGRLEGEHWCGHCGGGAGYYGEARVYPRLQAVSVLLLNRAGWRDEALLDRLDRHLLAVE
ncbi:MAG: beta-lactamase family protein [Curvibacter sp.]|nr:beta-lactamase family protein [Curvibacter sp.]